MNLSESYENNVSPFKTNTTIYFEKYNELFTKFRNNLSKSIDDDNLN